MPSCRADWQPVTLASGWTNLAGFIPAQAQFQRAGMCLLVGHITGGDSHQRHRDRTASPAGYYNPVHHHAFTANVIAGAAAVPVTGAITGNTDTNALTDGRVGGNSDWAAPGPTAQRELRATGQRPPPSRAITTAAARIQIAERAALPRGDQRLREPGRDGHQPRPHKHQRWADRSDTHELQHAHRHGQYSGWPLILSNCPRDSHPDQFQRASAAWKPLNPPIPHAPALYRPGLFHARRFPCPTSPRASPSPTTPDGSQTIHATANLQAAVTTNPEEDEA